LNTELTQEEILAILAENLRLKETLDRVKTAARHGARMDVHPTRMGGSPETMKEAMWWQNWLISFDSNWREAIAVALKPFEDEEVISYEIQQKLILAVIEEATLGELMDSPEEISHRIVEALRG
jgi:hypothetical protein